jgi:hypothetical protein
MMLHRRLHILYSLIITFFAMTLLSSSGAYAEDLPTDNPDVGDGTDEVGEWLQIVKSPNPIYVNKGETALFTIVVLNTSANFAMENVEVTDQHTSNCDRTVGNLPPGADPFSYLCTHPNVQVDFLNTVVVTGRNATNKQEDRASASAQVEVLELLTSIDPENAVIPAPGEVKFTVELTNKSSVKVELTELTSSQLGDLGDPQNDKVENNNCPAKIGKTMNAGQGSISCTFTTNVPGPPGDRPYDITAKGIADDVANISGSGATVVRIIEIISASLTSDSAKYSTGSIARLTATIENLSETTSVTILTLEDTILGDLPCSLPVTVLPGKFYPCSYNQTITGPAGEPQSFILNISAETDDKPPIALTDQASVEVEVIEPLAFLPVIFKPLNISCQTALWIETNRLLSFNVLNVDTFYKFELQQTSDITVEITDFSPTRGQVALYTYSGEDCIPPAAVVAEDRTIFNPDRTLVGQQQPAGIYFIRIVPGGNYSPTDEFNLIVNTK